MGCQRLRRVIDELFPNLKGGGGGFFFKDDMVVYLPSAENNVTHLHEVLGRLKRAGFTLNPDK